MAYENVKILSKHVGLCRIFTAPIAHSQLHWTHVSTLCGAKGQLFVEFRRIAIQNVSGNQPLD